MELDDYVKSYEIVICDHPDMRMLGDWRYCRDCEQYWHKYVFAHPHPYVVKKP